MVDQYSATPTSASATSSPTAPTSAVRVARIGGTVAELAAAAISAHTLYNLGGQLDLGPAFAWLLPAALDTYAFTAMAVGYNLPAEHPGQKPVLRNARLAFALTLGCNALDHFLCKAGRLVDPTVRDLLLVVVATLPPLVVERLLNLQSLLVGHRNRPTHPAGPETTDIVGEVSLAHDRTAEPPLELGSDGGPGNETAVGRRPDWTAHGRGVFAELSDKLGRRPSGREFQAALAIYTRNLVTEGRLAAATRPPSVTSAKRIRAVLEAEGAGGDPAIG